MTNRSPTEPGAVLLLVIVLDCFFVVGLGLWCSLHGMTAASVVIALLGLWIASWVDSQWQAKGLWE